MNKLRSIARCSALGLTLAGSLGFMQQALALPGVPIGQCVPKDGVKDFPFSFTQNFTDPEMNIAGRPIDNASQNSPWTSGIGGSYSVKCGCSGPIFNESFISAIPSSTEEVAVIGTKRYFAMKSNIYLAAASEVFIDGGVGYNVPVPFTNFGNKWFAAKHSCDDPKGVLYGSGSKGMVHLYFRRPFVGVTTFNETLMNIYINTDANAGLGSPVAQVTMSGSVTVPQKCDISGGMTIPIEFGDIMATSFINTGQRPVGFNRVHKELTLKCNNISKGVVVSLSIQGTPDPRINNALKTENNEDVAVVFENAAGVVIPVQTGRLPADMNGLGNLESTGKADVYMYPIKTGNKLPVAGEFNATATVKAEIQ